MAQEAAPRRVQGCDAAGIESSSFTGEGEAFFRERLITSKCGFSARGAWREVSQAAVFWRVADALQRGNPIKVKYAHSPARLSPIRTPPSSPSKVLRQTRHNYVLSSGR